MALKTGFVLIAAAALAAAPVFVPGGPGDVPAFAQGQGNGAGNGGGNGKGGGNGGGNGKGHGAGGVAAAGAETDHPGRGLGRGHAKGDTGLGRGHGNSHGSVSSELAGFNAAHSNEIARERAAPHSMPGKVRDYEEAMNQELDLGKSLRDAHDDAVSELGEAFDGLSDISDEAVGALADMLGLEER